MVSLNMIHNLGTELSQQGYNSHDNLRKLDNEIIDKLFESNNIINMLRFEINKYLDWLFLNHQYRYYKKMIAEKMTQNELDWCDLFLLARFAGDERAYRNLPLLLYLLIQKLDITKYKYASIEDITSVVYRTFDISTSYDIEKGILCEIKHKSSLNDYQKFDNIYNHDEVNANNMEEFARDEYGIHEMDFSIMRSFSRFVDSELNTKLHNIAVDLIHGKDVQKYKLDNIRALSVLNSSIDYIVCGLYLDIDGDFIPFSIPSGWKKGGD